MPTCAGRWRPAEPADEIVDRLVLPLVEKAVPEWQATLDALLSLPEIGGPVGYSGGVIAIGIRLAVVEPRIAAAGLFAGSFVPRTLFEEARQVSIPLQVLLQWDDEGERPAVGPRPVRRLRLQGEDAARQSGRAHRRPGVRGGRRGPVLRPASELAPGRPRCQASSRLWTVSARMPLIEDRRRPSSMAAASTCATAPSGAYGPVGGAPGHHRLHELRRRCGRRVVASITATSGFGARHQIPQPQRHKQPQSLRPRQCRQAPAALARRRRRIDHLQLGMVSGLGRCKRRVSVMCSPRNPYFSRQIRPYRRLSRQTPFHLLRKSRHIIVST